MIANTLGSLVGAALAVLIARRRSAFDPPAGDPPAADPSAADEHERAEQLASIEHAAEADLEELGVEQATAKLL